MRLEWDSSGKSQRGSGHRQTSMVFTCVNLPQFVNIDVSQC